jgi:3-phosphoshikimate 1-carboxyvinyltransferase
MSTPKLITPATGPLDALVRPPGSKSLTIRALAAAGLAHGSSRLLAPLDSDDTSFARTALGALGVQIIVEEDAWLIEGTGGRLAPSQAPLDAGPSGLTARILIGLSALVDGKTVITGRDRLPERPMLGIVDALTALGVRARAQDGSLPVEVHGTGRLPGGRAPVDTSQSTQFATALALVAPLASDPLRIELVGAQGAMGYLDLTSSVMRAFGVEISMSGKVLEVPNTGYRAATFPIEPDASAAVYPMLAAAMAGGRVTIDGLGTASRQPDMNVGGILEQMGCDVGMDGQTTTVSFAGGELSPVDVDMSNCPDGALAIAVACLRASGTSRLRGLGSLRFKESDRLDALATELSRLGATAEVKGEDLEIRPGPITPTLVETYSDHRMAMSFAVLGLVCDGLEIANPGVVSKTWPGFWKMLADLAS